MTSESIISGISLFKTNRKCFRFKKVVVLNSLLLGDILQEAVRQLEPGVKVGKILIQRDESTVEKTANLLYKKLPKDIPECFVMLVDPMLATAGMKLFRFTYT